jgi:hypothetical protein
MSNQASTDDDPWTYFGLFSKDQIFRVEELLNLKGIEFYKVKTEETEERLKAWSAWDVSSCDSREGHELFVHDKDIGKLGTALVDMFPERKFGDSN